MAGIAGGVAGRKIGENQQTKTETGSSANAKSSTPDLHRGHDIVYLAGQTHSARVAEDPGERIRLPVRSIDE